MPRRRRHSIKTSEIARRRRQHLIFRLSLFIVLFILLFFGIKLASGSKLLTIDHITVEGSKSSLVPNITRVAQNTMDGEYFHLISKRNVFFYPKDTIQKDILDQFQDIQSVDLQIEDFHTLVIRVKQYEAAFEWCVSYGDGLGETEEGGERASSSAPSIVNEDCYLLDQDGFVFSKNSQASSTKYLKFYGPLITPNSTSTASEDQDASGTMDFSPSNGTTSSSGAPDTTVLQALKAESPIGKDFLLPSTFLNVAKIIHTLEGRGFTIERVSSDGTGNITLSTNTYDIKVMALEDPEEITANLNAFLNSDIFQGSGAAKLRDLQYVDLRFGNKIYYK